MDQRLLERIHLIAARYRSIQMWKALAVVWTSTAAVGALCWLLRASGLGAFTDTPWLLLTLAMFASVVAVCFTRAMFRDDRWIAQRVESCFPELRQRLLTALEQRPDDDGRFGFLQRKVIDETLQHACLRPWAEKTVPRSQLVNARLWNLPAAFLFALVTAGLIFTKAPQTVTGKSTVDVPTPTRSSSTEVTVSPGDVEVERGTNLVVVARFAGPVPAEAHLVSLRPLEDPAPPDHAGNSTRLPMSRSLDDPVFGGSFHDISDAFSYYVEYEGQVSDSFRVTVFEYPTLVRSDARIVYPVYTGREAKVIEDTRRISAVEGSTIEWICHLNKRVMSAVLIDDKGRSTYLEPTDSQSTQYRAKIALYQTHRWEVQLIDEEGRTNKSRVELVAKMLKNGSPEITLEMARDISVSPLEEVSVSATIQDDYGLERFGISYVFGGGDAKEYVLGQNVRGKQRESAEFLLNFESLRAEPDQLLSYHFWAEDRGPDGNVRRSYSDIFFAEVRPFEEIFREGAPPPSGQSPQQPQGQNAQQAEQLAELQKQILNATWKVIRREISPKPTGDFKADTTLLRESQSKALEQVAELTDQLDDVGSIEHAEEVRKHMEVAINELTNAINGPSIESLSTALSAEQSAYQSLLKLRAREHEVARSQQPQSSSSGSAGRSRQQMQELELDSEQNRYETERMAQTQQQQEQGEQQREVRQVLNRLRELARRQEDLNKQLKDLQSALETAETEEEREEVRRQLQRLREQEQEMLRDVDELADRMDQSENQQEQMQEAREQLNQTRENVRQASESLQRENASEALTAGTRAERELKKMRDEFRREAANEFSEDMRQMRDAVQRLDEQQERLGQQIADLPKARSGRLRSANSRDQIRERVQEQRKDLEKLLDTMQETVKEAEATEPLLADDLYDSFRETEQRKVDENLGVVNELLRRGMDPQAQEVESGVGQSIEDLRNDIEKAAESVLGDETEGLRRALGELDQLVRELDSELNNADPNGASQQGPVQQRPSSEASVDADPSQNQASPWDQFGSDETKQMERSALGPSNQDSRRNRKEPTPKPNPDDNAGDGERPTQQSRSEKPTDNHPPSRQRGQNQTPAEGQQPSEGRPSSDQPNQTGQRPGQGGSESQQTGPPSQNPSSPKRDGGGGLSPFNEENLGSAPLTGDSFREWSDRLRDVEEMVENPQLRSEAARVRDRARDFRRDYKRNSKEPKWNDVRKLVADPLRELRQRVSQELIRRSAERTSLVPIDRDAVPDEYAEQVRRYYEQLGSGD